MAFFLPMKKTLLLLLFLAFSGIQAQEKVSYKKKKFFLPSIVYSKYPILDNVISQTSFYQIDKGLIRQEQYLKKKYFDIDGYIKEPVNGKLKIYVTIAMPKFTATKIDSTYDKKSRAWVYQPSSQFEVKVNIEVKCADKLILSEAFVTSEAFNLKATYRRSDLKTIVTENNKKLRDEDLKEAFDDDSGVEDVIYYSMDKAQNFLNYKLRYYKTETKEKFEFMTSKGHPEYKQMLDFENEITAQLEKVTLEKGLDEKLLAPHLAYLDGLLVKYPQTPENEAIRFVITNDLALTYLLLENKQKALFYADLLIKNDKRDSRGSDIIDRANTADFVDKKIRTHTNRFVDLKKLGFKISEEKEELRLAFFEKIDRQEADWEQEKATRVDFLEKSRIQRDNMLDSIAYQSNPDLLAKIINRLGGSENLKKIDKTHLTSKLVLEESNVPHTEERWATSTNFLLKKKMPETYYQIVNGPESWSHDDRESGVGAKWKKSSSADYSNHSANLDPINLITGFRLDLWNKYELLGEEMIAGQPCYHLTYFEKTLNSSNRTIPKTEHHLFIDKENFNIVSVEKTEFDDGNKSFFEKRTFKDYREVVALNNGKVPYKIQYEIEDFYGDTLYEEQRDKVEINPMFANRIFIKEVYFGSFK
jgi:hypothetical protein